MKRLINIFLIVLFLFTLTSCIEDEPIDKNGNGNNEEMDDVLNIYTLNDFHGAIFANPANRELGISRIGNFLKKEKVQNPNNTIILSAGDMFQGSALSSLTRGEIVVDLMNNIGFDAMAIGNHEFDWGVDEIIRYVDGDETNGEANFPFLAANIYHNPTDKFVDWAKPYTVIKKGDLKIGILGLIGEGLTSSILGSISKDYTFTSELNTIKQYVPILRNEEGADIVIVLTHSDTSRINYELKNLDGDYYVDAVINGHTHQYYAYEEERGIKPPLVVIQSGSNGQYIGHIKLELDLKEKRVKYATAGFVSESKLKDESTEINELISTYQEFIDIENEVLGTAGQNIYKPEGTTWAVNVMGKFNEVDFGIINAGGIRTAGFPINKGSEVTYGSIFKILPFENEVITAKLTGSQIKRLNSASSDLRYSIHLNTNNWTIGGKPIEDEQLYNVAVLDFVFYRYEYIFMYAQDIEYHNIIFRDLLVEDVREKVLETGKWNLN